MTKNAAWKKEARQYMVEFPGTKLTDAMRLTKRLKAGHRVRVTIPHTARWEGTVVDVEGSKVRVKRKSDGSITTHDRQQVDFIGNLNE